MKLLNRILVIVLLLGASSARAFEGSGSSWSSALLWILEMGQRRNEAVTSVTKTSLFADSYSVSRVSGRDVIEIISQQPLKAKKVDDVRAYLRDQYHLDDDDLDRATRLVHKADVAVARWINQLDAVTDDDVRAAEMANAADQVRLKQLEFEADLLLARSEPGRSVIYRRAIEGFDEYLELAVGHGGYE